MTLSHVARGQAVPSAQHNEMVDLLTGAPGAIPIGNWLQVFNVRKYGATGDGATDDSAAIVATLAAAVAGGVIYFPKGTYKVAADVTFPAQNDVVLAAQAIIKPENTYTVTFNGTFTAPHAKAFEYVGTGKVAFGSVAMPRDYYPQWWDARGDGVTDDTVAVTRTVAAIGTAKRGVLAILPGKYVLSGPVTHPLGGTVLVVRGIPSRREQTGNGDCVLATKAGFAGTAVIVEDQPVGDFTSNGLVVEDIGLDARAAPVEGVFISRQRYLSDAQVRRVSMRGCTRFVHLVGYVWDGTFEDIRVYSDENVTGLVKLETGAFADGPKLNTFRDLYFNNPTAIRTMTEDGIYLDANAHYNLFDNVRVGGWTWTLAVVDVLGSYNRFTGLQTLDITASGGYAGRGILDVQGASNEFDGCKLSAMGGKIVSFRGANAKRNVVRGCEWWVAGAITTEADTGGVNLLFDNHPQTGVAATYTFTGTAALVADVTTSFLGSTWLEFVNGGLLVTSPGGTALAVRKTGDTWRRMYVNELGQLLFGSGAGAEDVTLERGGANILELASGDSFRLTDGDFTVRNAASLIRAILGRGSAGNHGMVEVYDSTLAAYRFLYIDNGQIVIDDTSPT